MTNEHSPDLLRQFFETLRTGSADEVADHLERDPALTEVFDPNPWCCRATPLNVAVSRADATIVRLLLEHGADPDRKSDWWAGGFAALHSVRTGSGEEILRLLLDAGATVDEHAAAKHSLSDRLNELLDQWPMRVNAPGGDGGRPLHFAADPSIAELLLDRGAWIDAVDVDHVSTPAQWAVDERPEVATFLISRGASTDPFMLSALDDAGALAAALGDDGPAASIRLTAESFPSPGSEAGHIYRFNLGGYGSTLLHVAARAGALGTMRLLIKAGADLAAIGGNGEPAPLHAAACNDRVEAVELLLDAGAAIDQLSGDPHYSSPLTWANACGSSSAAAALESAGAKALERE